ncbi:hypothetical protein V8F06_011974 [Rhypophila decipiens]
MKILQSLSVALGLMVVARAAPAGAKEYESLQRRGPREYLDCSPEQQGALQAALGDMFRITDKPLQEFFVDGVNSFDPNKLAYAHYFRNEDRSKVADAFKALHDASNPAMSLAVSYNIQCAGEGAAGCASGDLAFTQPFPEDFVGGGEIAGVRKVIVCPGFFTESRTTRRLPESQEEIDAYCQFKESKKFNEFETGAHTLLHEISHLDSFGRAAGYPVRNQEAGLHFPSYDYQGTDDWHQISTPGNARTLKSGNAGDKIETFENAESLAAFSLEYWVATVCGLEDVPL